MAKETMTLDQVMEALEGFGNEGTKKVFLKHGAKEPVFGVKVQDLKKLQKRIKKDHGLSLDLYATGNSDAMYLAGLIADEGEISKAELEEWAKGAYWYYLSEYVVPWVAAESGYGWELATKWIDADTEGVAAAGWATLTMLSAIAADDALDIPAYGALLDRVEAGIHDAPNRVRYTMNGFVIAVASYIVGLTEKAKITAGKIGKVSVDMGGTACKVPLATTYIQKVAARGSVGKKRKTFRR